MIKIIKNILILLTLTLSLPTLSEQNYYSDSVILVDYNTGQVLYEKNSNTKKEIASLTKIMTAYILFDYIQENNIDIYNTLIPISRNGVVIARRTNSSRSFYEQRHEVTYHEIIQGLIVHSGNDAAISIAEHISGTEEQFVELMNQYAYNLGMFNTVYQNSSGLPTVEEQYSTAYDQALLSRKIIQDFKEYYDRYFSQEEYTHNNIFQQSRNRLLRIDPRFDGIKTGWTVRSGYSFATSIYENGRRLIITTIDAERPEQRFTDAINLAKYGFDNFINISIFEAMQPIQGAEKIPLFKSDDLFAEIVAEDYFYFTIRKEDISKIDFEIEMPENIIAPISNHEKIGEVNILFDNEIIQTINLISKKAYPVGNTKDYLLDSLYLYLNNN